ncbi:unnamed protein product, partial [Mesorhabditis spiculigera]
MSNLPIDEIALVATVSPGQQSGTESVQVVVRQGDLCSSRRKRLLSKFRRIPFCYILVLSLGSLLLLSILSCIIYETYRNGALSFDPELVEHDSADRDYHRGLVDEVNNQGSTWQARYNRYASRSQENNGVDMGEVSKLLHKKQNLSDAEVLQDTKEHLEELTRKQVKLPDSYDVRLEWSRCSSVHIAPNQGGCGSCWSVSAASTMSDRLCISTNGSEQSQLSAQQLTSCCANCGGCQGTHWAHSSFVYWKEEGLVSGGMYGSNEGCRPYEIAPNCGSPCSSSTYTKKRTPHCSKTCQPFYAKTYHEDVHKSRKAYWIWAEKGGSEATPIIHKTIHSIVKESGADIIKKEIFLHGPILACFTLFEDFQHYDRGIYKSKSVKDPKELYGHCAKLIGWGVENGTKYWTYMNTWGRDWGEYGFFRIDQSEIPEEAVAGLP